MRPLRKHANQETTLLKIALDEAFEEAERKGTHSHLPPDDIKNLECSLQIKIALNRLTREQFCSEMIPFPEVDTARERIRSRVVIRKMRERGERGALTQLASASSRKKQ